MSTVQVQALSTLKEAAVNAKSIAKGLQETADYNLALKLQQEDDFALALSLQGEEVGGAILGAVANSQEMLDYDYALALSLQAEELAGVISDVYNF